MKKSASKATVVEVANEGLIAYLDKSVTLFCANYIYTGVLEGVNDTCVKLRDAYIVYETGELTSKQWKDAQSLGGEWYVQLSAVESFGPGK